MLAAGSMPVADKISARVKHRAAKATLRAEYLISLLADILKNTPERLIHNISV
jgi:hypothetical protein